MYGMGTNGTFDTLADKLETIIAEKEAAPEEYVEVLMNSPEGIQLRAFAHQYLGPQAPEYKDTFDLMVNQNMLKTIKDTTGKDIVAPPWLMTHFKVPKALYDLFRQSCARVQRLMQKYGITTPATADMADMAKCLIWWETHDRAGASALKAMSITRTPETISSIGIPKNLFDFWKANQGALPPTQSMLGMGLMAWLGANWLYVAAGAGGALVLTRVLQKRRARARLSAGEVGLARNPAYSLERLRTKKGGAPGPGYVWRRRHLTKVPRHLWRPGQPRRKEVPGQWVRKGKIRGMPAWGDWEGLEANPKRKERREGWPVPVMVKGEKMKLYPILTIAESRRARVDMSKAKRFRVSYQGMSLGELHRSTGKRPWKAITYAGRVKYGTQRSALLSWMKKEMVPEVQGPQLPAANPRRKKGLAGFMSPGVRGAIDPYGEGRWEEVWDPKTKQYVVAPFGGVAKTQGPQTKREMRELGYKYDLYTGEPL